MVRTIIVIVMVKVMSMIILMVIVTVMVKMMVMVRMMVIVIVIVMVLVVVIAMVMMMVQFIGNGVCCTPIFVFFYLRVICIEHFINGSCTDQYFFDILLSKRCTIRK